MTKAIRARGYVESVGFTLFVLFAATPKLAQAEAELPAVPTPATCGEENQTEEHAPWGKVFFSRFYSKQVFAPRPQPATEIKATELEMLQRGYVGIGWMEVSRFTTFYERDKNPDGVPIAGPASLSDFVLQEAAQRGGDAYTFFEDAPLNEQLPEPRPAGMPSGSQRGTNRRGMVWRKAPERSKAQLLVYAAQMGKAQVVQKLLANSAAVSVDSREPRFCQTALISAALYGHVEVVRLLLAARPKLELTDTYGRTALSYAAFPTSGKGCAAAQPLRQAGAHEPKLPEGHYSFDFPAPKRCPK